MCLLHLPAHRHYKPSDSSVYVGFLSGSFSGLHRTMWRSPPLQIADQTFYAGPQWRLALQVGTWGDTEGILFCGFRLHKHHYHLPDLELGQGCSAATPILSGALNGDACGLPGTRAIESTKKEFSLRERSVRHVGMRVVCVWARVRISRTCADSVIFSTPPPGTVSIFPPSKVFWLCLCQI